MKQALTNTDWDTILGDPSQIEKANENFSKALVEATKIANVPLYKSHKETRKKTQNKTTLT